MVEDDGCGVFDLDFYRNRTRERVRDTAAKLRVARGLAADGEF